MDWKVYEENYQEKAKTVIDWLNNEFAKLRTGRLSPSVLDGIKADSYGDLVPIQNIANISVPEARIVIIKPYDASTIKDIAAAINQSNLGVNPQVDAEKIRLYFPPLTEDMRKDLAKKAKALSEEAKVKIRRIRQDIQDMYKKDDELTDDQKRNYATNLDNFTKKINNEIERILEEKIKALVI